MTDPAAAGRLTLVDIGPGGLDYLTRRAERAIREAAVVAGYRLYLELAIPLVEDKEFIEFPMWSEVERAREAVSRARNGQRVAW